jgi:hypothetical protein
MKHLGIQMIAAYSPKVRGRSERAFLTHQDRLPKELALHGITDMDAADRYLEKEYKPDFNSEFMQPPAEERSAFVPYAGGEHLDDILCVQDLYFYILRTTRNKFGLKLTSMLFRFPAVLLQSAPVPSPASIRSAYRRPSGTGSFRPCS